MSYDATRVIVYIKNKTILLRYFKFQLRNSIITTSGFVILSYYCFRPTIKLYFGAIPCIGTEALCHVNFSSIVKFGWNDQGYNEMKSVTFLRSQMIT
jgi:hypothetical protein